MVDAGARGLEVVGDKVVDGPAKNLLRLLQLLFPLPLYSLDEAEESLGLDSLDALEIATVLEEAFDVVLPTEIDPAELRTVRQVMALLERVLTEQHGDTGD